MRVRNLFLTSFTALSVVVPASAALQGVALAIKQTDYWQKGNLVAIEVPNTANTKTLSTGSCMGPCFSPDGQRAAYVVSGTIHTIGLDGQSDVNTGIAVTLGSDADNMTALHWIDLGESGQYFYWNQNGTGVIRCKTDGTGRQVVWSKTNVAYFGLASNGVKGVFADNGRNVGTVNLSTLAATEQGAGCNASISSDGARYIYSNRDNIATTVHHVGMVRDWTTGATVTQLTFDCATIQFRWSQHSPDALCYWRWSEWDDCTTAVTGAIREYSTGTEYSIGQCGAYDFYPGITLTGQKSVASPEFTPAGGTYAAGPLSVKITCATPGAQIRYTTNGVNPTATTGTVIASGSSISVNLVRSDSVVVKAQAYPPDVSLLPSVVARAVYKGPPSIPPVAVTGPNAGDLWHVGDTVYITWTADTSASPRLTEARIFLTPDDGLTMLDVTVGQTVKLTDANWGRYQWVVPASMNASGTTVPVHSSTASICIQDYINSSVSGCSGTFTIASAPMVNRTANRDRRGVTAANVAVNIYDLRGRLVRTGAVRGRGIRLIATGAPKSGVRVLAGVHEGTR